METTTNKRYFMEIEGDDPEFIEGVLVGCTDDGQRARCLGLAEANDWINTHQHFVHRNSGLKEIELTLDNPHDEVATLRRAIMQVIASGNRAAATIADEMDLKRATLYYHLGVLKDEGKITAVGKARAQRYWLADEDPLSQSENS